MLSSDGQTPEVENQGPKTMINSGVVVELCSPDTLIDVNEALTKRLNLRGTMSIFISLSKSLKQGEAKAHPRRASAVPQAGPPEEDFPPVKELGWGVFVRLFRRPTGSTSNPLIPVTSTLPP